MLGYTHSPKVRKGVQPETTLSKEEFWARYQRQFYDPHFAKAQVQINELTEIAWQNYQEHRKAPLTTKAGKDFADPNYDMSLEWLETRQRLQRAEQNQKTAAKSRILLINGSPRNEHTCPGEVSKSYRLALEAQKTILANGFECELLDLSTLTAEYGRTIHPCKACVSTAMPLCHWPCTCYPNHSLGQGTDWMNEIYEKWVSAHGVMILTPVHWYGLPTPLKLMVDRLVCADGGNPDPTTTHGKNADEAKKIELKGWDYPKHLAGRAFSVIVHGDTTGIDNVRRNLTDWLNDMELIPAGASSEVSRYIGYYKPYATGHEDLDEYQALFKDVENAALSLMQQIDLIRSGRFTKADENIKPAEKK